MDEADHLHQLMARCALRDQRAFGELYRFTSAKLYGVALRILRREDWAEDVLQESFVNIWNHIAEYSATRSAPMTWMTAIVRNRALDSLPDPGPSPDVALGHSRGAAALAECLRQLSGDQRQTIVLAYMHGLSHG